MADQDYVYVVLEEDRGCGPSIVAVYRSKEEAEKAVASSRRYWMEEEILI